MRQNEYQKPGADKNVRFSTIKLHSNLHCHIKSGIIVTGNEVSKCTDLNLKRIYAVRLNMDLMFSEANGTPALSACLPLKKHGRCACLGFKIAYRKRTRQRKSYDEIPPRVEYSLTKRGLSAVPILQSICTWAGAYYKNENDTSMIQCRKCDHNH